MPTPLVEQTEVGYIRMRARTRLAKQKQAEAAGQAYQPTGVAVELHSGHTVKLQLMILDGQEVPHLTVDLKPGFVGHGNTLAREIATAILGGKVKVAHTVMGIDKEFTLDV